MFKNVSKEEYIKFKKLVLATGEEFENVFLDMNTKELDKCLPNRATVILGKQKIIINTDFILSVELENKLLDVTAVG